MGKPDFILIGETKCGTTSMFNYLRKHPLILESLGNGEAYDEVYRTKELRFFDKFYDRGWDWYYSRFPETGPGEITGEATPMYMYRSLVARRIKEKLPNIKLIVLLRNPVDRLISNFEHNRKWVPGWEELYPDLKTYFSSCLDRDYYQIEKSIYYYSFLKWFEHFSRDQFCIIRSEDMFDTPQKTYLQVTRFLGVDDHQHSDFKVFRENQYPAIDLGFRKELEEFYQTFNKKLEVLLGRKMHWDK